MNLTTATPTEIDTRAAELDAEYLRAQARLAAALDTIHGWVEVRPALGRGGRKLWQLSDTAATLRAEQSMVEGKGMAHERDRIQNALRTAREMETAIADNQEQSDKIQAEYDRRPWSRFILVQGGHIHSGRFCKGGSIKVTTQLMWRPELSGQTEAQAVAALGPLLCTHCFPSAPVEWTIGREKPARCEGSGQQEKPGTYRRRGMTGTGVCRVCNTGQTVTSRGYIRAHKPAN